MKKKNHQKCAMWKISCQIFSFLAKPNQASEYFTYSGGMLGFIEFNIYFHCSSALPLFCTLQLDMSYQNSSQKTMFGHKGKQTDLVRIQRLLQAITVGRGCKA